MVIQQRKIVLLMDLNFLSLTQIIINAEYFLNSSQLKPKCSDFSPAFLKYLNANKKLSELSF